MKGEQHAEKRPVMKLLAVLAVLEKQNAGEWNQELGETSSEWKQELGETSLL